MKACRNRNCESSRTFSTESQPGGGQGGVRAYREWQGNGSDWSRGQTPELRE